MKRDHCKNGNSFTNRHLQLALHVSIYLQCISPHGCTFGRFQLQHRCKQSYHGKRQPGSYRLQTQSEVSRKSMNWNFVWTLTFYGSVSARWADDVLPGEYLTLEMISLPSVCIETRSRVSVSSTNHLQHTRQRFGKMHMTRIQIGRL